MSLLEQYCHSTAKTHQQLSTILFADVSNTPGRKRLKRLETVTPKTPCSIGVRIAASEELSQLVTRSAGSISVQQLIVRKSNSRGDLPLCDALPDRGIDWQGRDTASS